jgi:integrase
VEDLSKEIKKETKTKNASIYQISEEDIHKMISYAKNRRNRLVIEILAFTGCRRGELVLIRRMDIDLSKMIIHMPTIKRKGNPYQHSRIVPIISERFRSDLEFYLEITELKYKPSGYSKLIRSVQNRKKDGIDVVRVNQILAEIAERAEIKSPNPNRKNINPHALRHSFVRLARKYGLDFKVISQIVGHRSIKTTFDVYGIPSEEEIINESKKMFDFGAGKNVPVFIKTYENINEEEK